MLDQAQRPDAAPKLVALAREATLAAEALLADATAAVRRRVMIDERWSMGCSIASSARPMVWPGSRPTSKAIRQLAAYAERMHDGRRARARSSN